VEAVVLWPGSGGDSGGDGSGLKSGTSSAGAGGSTGVGIGIGTSAAAIAGAEDEEVLAVKKAGKEACGAIHDGCGAASADDGCDNCICVCR
jgi:hypothetical protein